MSKTMNFKFELHTTISEPLHIIVDSNNTTMKELYEQLYGQIERSTAFNREDIVDIFAQDTLSLGILSIPSSNELVKDFIPMHRDYFPFGLVMKDTYKLYAIDRMYSIRLKPPLLSQPLQKRELKTNHMGGFIQAVKQLFSYK